MSFQELPERKIQTAALSSTTPSVLNVERLKFVNTGSVTVTDFLYGQEGQELTIYGDGFTTLTHGTKIKTSTAANKLLATNKVYKFVRFSSVWVEQDAGSSISAGAGISVSGSTIANLYVGKAITLYSGDVVHTATGTLDLFPNNLGQYTALVDLTGMTQYRVQIVAKGSGGTADSAFSLSYGTTWGTWTDTSIASGISINTTLQKYSSSFISLPAGAQNASIFITLKMNIASANLQVYTVQLEFKP